MRARMRTALIAAGGAVLVLLALLIATAVTGSLTLALITGVVGILGVIGALALALKATGLVIESGDRTATRISNVEKRRAGEISRATAQTRRRDEVPGDVGARPRTGQAVQ